MERKRDPVNLKRRNGWFLGVGNDCVCIMCIGRRQCTESVIEWWPSLALTWRWNSSTNSSSIRCQPAVVTSGIWLGFLICSCSSRVFENSQQVITSMVIKYWGHCLIQGSASASFDSLDVLSKLKLSYFLLECPVQAPGCKNKPAPFPGRMLYRATKPGLVLFNVLGCFNCIVAY